MSQLRSQTHLSAAQAVVTVPASFTLAQREAMQVATTWAGIRVSCPACLPFCRVRMQQEGSGCLSGAAVLESQMTRRMSCALQSHLLPHLRFCCVAAGVAAD